VIKRYRQVNKTYYGQVNKTYYEQRKSILAARLVATSKTQSMFVFWIAYVVWISN